MRRPHKLLALGVICAALMTASSVDAATGPPTRAQIRAAIRTATRSHLLWATINDCDARGSHVLGIRGEMPALSFPARLVMVAAVSEWSATAHRYVPLKGSWRLGGQAFKPGAVVQDGVSLRLSAGATLIGAITFEWFRDGKLLGSTTRATTSGHGGSDAGTPTGTSVATCTIA